LRKIDTEHHFSGLQTFQIYGCVMLRCQQGNQTNFMTEWLALHMRVLT
jgi:hypothetical protein